MFIFWKKCLNDFVSNFEIRDKSGIRKSCQKILIIFLSQLVAFKIRRPCNNFKISINFQDVLATILIAIVVVLMVFILARALFLHNSRIEQLESRENVTKLQFEDLQQKYQEILKQIAEIRAEKGNWKKAVYDFLVSFG